MTTLEDILKYGGDYSTESDYNSHANWGNCPLPDYYNLEELSQEKTTIREKSSGTVMKVKVIKFRGNFPSISLYGEKVVVDND